MSGDWEIHGIFHFTINVSNFERSLAFYQQIGFKLLRDNRDVVWPAFVARNFGMKRAQARGALLAIGEGAEHTRIDLLEWLEPKAVDPRAAYEELRAKGVSFLSEPFIPDAALGIEAVVCCRDPDGLIVEFIEYSPGVLGSRIASLERRPS
jgi:catechol 2,3-dioxygenase-like lactoylglutathione lyase family enzyme